MRKVFLAMICFGLWIPAVAANDIYFAQTAAGSNNGADCTNAYGIADGTHGINVSGNWVPGNVLHLCGTITGSAGATLITSRASGSAGNPIIIRFEAGAILAAPYWNSVNGAISINGHSYITIDGGTNGLIENTLNGTSGQTCPGGTCAFQQTSKGLVAVSANNLIVKHLTVSNFYIRQEDSTTDTTDVICVEADDSDNILFDGNSLDHCRIGFAYIVATSATHGPGEISNNQLTFVEHGMTIAVAATNGILNGVSIHNNDFGGGAYLWDSGSPNFWHHDPIHMFSQTSGASVTNVKIYNNYFHGIWSRDAGYAATHITAMIFLEQIGSGSNIFNNVVDLSQGGVLNQPANGDVFCKGPGSDSCKLYNNLFIHTNDYSEAFGCSSNSGHEFRNNIVNNTDGIYAPSGCSIAAADYNLYYLASNFGTNGQSFSAWQALGYDIHGQNGLNPKLNANYTLQAGSPAIGTNIPSPQADDLWSLGIAALDADKAGTVRPSTGPWDLGVYQFSSTAVTLNPPMNLAATVN